MYILISIISIFYYCFVMLHWLFVRMKSEERDELGYKGSFICSGRIALLMELFPFSLESWKAVLQW